MDAPARSASAEAFLAAAASGDSASATAVLRAHPDVAATSLHAAAVLGDEPAVRRLIALDPRRVRVRAGDLAGEPLLWLCHSPYHGESPDRNAGLRASARMLLDAGADPNARDGRNGLPALYAVTGARNVPQIARLLLEAGAEATDGESIFHAAEAFHEEALELLLEFGVELNATGEWGNTPLYFLLRYWDVERMPRVRQGLLWLLDHGADPNARCGRERETSLHAAVRRGQATSVLQLLLDRGAEVNARRADGRTPWLLAVRGGFGELTNLLEECGAEPEPLSPADRLMAACGRGDVEGARALSSQGVLVSLATEDAELLPRGAARGHADIVRACLAAGLPVDAADEGGASALHHAAIHGRARIVRELLRAGADFELRDREHGSTPVGWAAFGADYVADADGDYEDAMRALLEAGARLTSDDHRPAHAGVRNVVQAREEGAS